MLDRSGEHGIKVFWQFESLQELFGVKLATVNAEHGDRVIFLPSAQAKNLDTVREWRGGLSGVEEYRTFVNRGWSDGTKRMREKIGALSVPPVKSVKRRQTWKDEGDEIDVTRVWNGDLEHAWRGTVPRMVEGGTSHVRVYVMGGYTASHKSDEFFWRGAVACLLVDALEEAGYRAEVIVYNQSCHTYGECREGYCGKKPDQVTVTPIKQYDEPLDIERMAAITAHPAFFRTAVFAAKLAAPYKAGDGLGKSIHIRPLWADEKDVVIDSVHTLDDARELLTTTLANFGTSSEVPA